MQGLDSLSVVQSLRKKKTYAAQCAMQGEPDALDRMDTGFELSAAELELQRKFDQMLMSDAAVGDIEQVRWSSKQTVYTARSPVLCTKCICATDP